MVYAPLADAPVEPDLVLVFADARQGLVVTEAAPRSSPMRCPRSADPPARSCRRSSTLVARARSLGCRGARAYVGALDDGTALWALPGANLARYAERIEVLAAATTTLARFHELRAEDVGAGGDPTYAESMARLAR